MEKGERFRRSSRPTMQQLRYLEQLKCADKKRGVQRNIAISCGVNASTINRFFKGLIDRDILTEELEFTTKGGEWYDGYKRLYEELIEYLRDIGSREDEVVPTADTMVETIDMHMLLLMIRSHKQKKSVYVRKNKYQDIISERTLNKLEEHKVVIYIYKINRKNDAAKESMAMRGFEPTAYIVHNNGSSYLKLTMKDVSANSRLNGLTMSGHVQTLKYEKDARLYEAIIDNGTVKIPIDAFQFHNWEDTGLMAWVPITIICSVGRVHMPESTALLYFWA